MIKILAILLCVAIGAALTLMGAQLDPPETFE